MALSRIPMIPEGTAGQPDTWPAAVPSTFNGPLSVVQDNLDVLEAVADDVTAAASGSDSLADKISSMATALESLSASDASAVLAAALFGQQQAGLHMALELFLGGVTLLDDLSNVSVLEAVAGDDSLDITDPDGVVAVGRDYILSDGTNSEQITVTTLLADGRIRVSSPLAHAYRDATLSRTDWTVSTARATAGNAQRYFAGPFSFGQRAKTVLARRTGNDCVLRCFYRRDSDDQWSETASDLELSGNALDGLVDQAWTIPSDGGNDEPFSVQIISQHGTEEVDAVIEHLAVVEDGTTARIPVISVQGADALDEQTPAAVTLTNAGDYEWDTRLELRVLNTAGSDVTSQFTISFAANAATGTITPPDVAAAGQAFTVQARIGEEGLVRSAWSKGVTIQVGDIPINRPEITSPVSGAENVGETPTVIWSDFSADGDQAQQAAELRIASDSNMQNIVHTASLGAVSSYDVPADILDSGEAYYVDVRVQGDDDLWSPRSVPVMFFTADTFAVVHAPVFLSPLAGATDRPDGFTITLDDYAHTGAGAHAGTLVKILDASDDSELWSSGWLGAVTEVDYPGGYVDVSTAIKIVAQMRDDSDPVVESAQTVINCTTAATYSDNAVYASWDGVTEQDWANTLMMLVANPTAGGNEYGQGAGLSNVLFTQAGALPGAVDGFRSNAAKTGHLTVPAATICNIVGGQLTWSVILKAKDMGGYYNGYGLRWFHNVYENGAIGWMANNNKIWLSFFTEYPSAAMPESGEVWLAWWCDGMDVRCGWSTAKPVKWSDFGADNRCISSKLSPADFTGVTPAVSNYDIIGDIEGYSPPLSIGGVLVSRDCLIDNES